MFTKTLILMVASLAVCSSSYGADAPVLKTESDRISYSMGLEVARNFKRNDIEFDPNMVLRGMQDGLSGERALVSEKEFRKILGDFQNQVRLKMAANRQMLTIENRKKAESFLAANKSKDGVVASLNGIQYQVIAPGNGPKPTDIDKVQFSFRGTTLEGREFDATEPGRPGVAQVVELQNGLKTVIKWMPVGSHWKVWIPPQLGFGERGVGSDVGPNELLVYDVELLNIVPR
jgi:FKBP-type peptidyl-prolyl cis-trans isomerase